MESGEYVVLAGNGENFQKTADRAQDQSNDSDPGTTLSLDIPRVGTSSEVVSSHPPCPAPRASQYWWEKTGPLMNGLLSKANYAALSRDKILSFYRTHLVPLLGPVPNSGDEDNTAAPTGTWRSSITDDSSPLEPSWNIHGDQCMVRLSLEPIGIHAGTSQDPFNQSTSFECMRKFAASMEFVDLALFEHFVAHFYIAENSAEVAKIQAKLPPGEPISQFFVAFDFGHENWSVKTYFFPQLKAFETGESNFQIVKNSILSLAPKTSWGTQMVESMSALQGWIASYGEEAKVELVSLDCVEEAKSRIKIYVRIPYTSLAKVKEAYSLGGRLDDKCTRKGLKLLDELWRLIFQLPPNANEDDELPVNKHKFAGTIFNFELRPGNSLPEPKLYLPVHHYCSSDIAIAEQLQKFFGRMGWDRLANEYKRDIQEVFSHHPLSTTAGTHTYIAFAYKEDKGVYLTMYYNPRIFSV